MEVINNPIFTIPDIRYGDNLVLNGMLIRCDIFLNEISVCAVVPM